MNNSKKQEHAATSVVYHFHHYFFGLIPLGIRPQWPLDYEPVAHVVNSKLDEVFRLTQGVELSSEDDELVSWFDVFHPHRSTMVGDVIVVDDGKSIRTWRCTNDNWELISPYCFG